MRNVTSFSNSMPARFSPLELPSTDTIPNWFTIVFAAINGGGFCLNTLSLWLLLTRKIVYKFKVNAFIVSLCVSDFLVSLSGFYFLGTITSSSVSQFSRRVATIIFGFSLETSLMSLCNLSFERLTAVRKPFRYHEILSTGNLLLIYLEYFLQYIAKNSRKDNRQNLFNKEICFYLLCCSVCVLLC